MATNRQKLAIDKLVENGGKSVSAAMREAGYSAVTAKNPSKLTNSNAYQELMDIYLPDDMLLRALSDDIENKEKNRKQELELAFKLKGKLTDRVDHTTGGKPLPLLGGLSNGDNNDNNEEIT